MGVIEDLQSGVTELTTVIDSSIQLMNNISALLAQAIASATPVAEVQAVIDTINAKKAELAEAVAANTPGVG